MCSAIERTEMKRKIYLSEAWMCSEFGYQRPMSDKKGLSSQVPVLNSISIFLSFVDKHMYMSVSRSCLIVFICSEKNKSKCLLAIFHFRSRARFTGLKVTIQRSYFMQLINGKNWLRKKVIHKTFIELNVCRGRDS